MTEQTIAASGVRSAASDEVRRITGVEGAGAGLVFPYHGCEGPNGSIFERVKLDTPLGNEEGGGAKYLSPIKQLNPEGNRLYVPATVSPAVLTDPGRPLIITEGEKKALKATQDGFPTIALPGVWGFRKRDAEGESRPIGDLVSVEWENRPVAIVFDSDAATNPKVRQAEVALRDELRRRGAKPFIVRLPDPTPEETDRFGSRLGLDDFLVARGADALRRLIERLPLGCTTVAQAPGAADGPRRWLIEGFWPAKGCGFIAGEPKAFKSWIAAHLTVSIGAGVPFLGWSVEGPARIVLVDEESPPDESCDRLRRTALGLGVPWQNIEHQVYVVPQGRLRLDSPESMDQLEELIERTSPSLVILDPLVRLHECNENESAGIGPLLGRLRRMSQKFGTAVLIVHHLGKKTELKRGFGQRLRGTSDLHGWLDAAIYGERSGTKVRLSFETRCSSAPAPRVVEPVFLPDGGPVSWELLEAAEAPQRTQSERPLDAGERIKRALGQSAAGVSRGALLKQTGLSALEFETALGALVEKREVERQERRTKGRPAQWYWLNGTSGRGGDAPRVPSDAPPPSEGEGGKKEVPEPSLLGPNGSAPGEAGPPGEHSSSFRPPPLSAAASGEKK